MAAHRDILETIPSEFDYYGPKILQAAILNEYDHDYHPLSTLQTGGVIEFQIQGADNIFLDVSNSKLEIKCQIVIANGDPIPANLNCGPVNLALHSLFSNVELQLCGKTISDPNNLYAYRAFFETMLNNDIAIARTRLWTIGWDKDKLAHFDDFSRADNGTNDGFKRRAARFAESHVVTLTGRLHLDLFHQDKDIPPNCSMKIRLIPQTHAFFVKKLANVDQNLQIRIRSARLFMRQKEVSPSLLLAHESMLQKQNMRLSYTKIRMKQLAIPVGVTNIEFDNLYSGVLPDRLLFAMIADNRFAGAHTLNPFLFQNFGLNFIALKVNGEQIPRIAYQPNFEREDYIREYLGLLEALGLDIGNKAIDLTAQEWAESFPIFIFRFSPNGLPSLPRTGSARLSIRFQAATTANISGILYAEFPEILEIDRYRNIID